MLGNGLVLWCVLLLPLVAAMARGERAIMKERVREMFYHGYNNYMEYAFPHDELKPLSASYTDSLAELGNAKLKKGSNYGGVAMTRIDALSTLAVMGDKEEFSRAVSWVVDNVDFDVDVRVNVFEANIRLLGGMLSAHALALDPALALMPEYDGGLLRLAEDLGGRLLKAFSTESGLPYAWVNLKNGVEYNETGEQCTAGVGTLLIEFGLLSHYTGNDAYFEAAFKSQIKLWELRSPYNLMGNTFDVKTLEWLNTNAGIGAGIDSFYEYLFKAYLLFGNSKFLTMFEAAYTASQKYLKAGDWYVEANMQTGAHTHVHFNSLQAFMPGLQVLVGDVDKAVATQANFFGLWERYNGLPERFLLSSNSLHSSERYYPLRPELIESTYYLHRATKDPRYLEMGVRMFWSLENVSRVEHGYASIRDVNTGEVEDHMSSFFLSETTKYLYLLFDDDNFAHSSQYLFTTEGHLVPFSSAIQAKYGDDSRFGDGQGPLHEGTRKCPMHKFTAAKSVWKGLDMRNENRGTTSSNAVHVCKPMVPKAQAAPVAITMGEGSFHVAHNDGETVTLRNLGTSLVEMVNAHKGRREHLVFHSEGVVRFFVSHGGHTVLAMGSYFGPLPGMQSTLKEAVAAEDFAASGELSVSADFVKAIPGDACRELEEPDRYDGKIVYVVRGDCTFVTKVSLLQAAGAVGVVIGDVWEDSLFLISRDGTDRPIHIPVFTVDKDTAVLLTESMEEAGPGVSSVAKMWVELERTHPMQDQPTKLDPLLSPSPIASLSVVVSSLSSLSSTSDSEEADWSTGQHLKVVGTFEQFAATTMGGLHLLLTKDAATYALQVTTEQSSS
jgi:mannosidase alpha-like ER degradation enhancer 1